LVDRLRFHRVQPFPNRVERLIDHDIGELSAGRDFIHEAFAQQLRIGIVASRFAGAGSQPD
jgi:hypothetical protein